MRSNLEERERASHLEERTRLPKIKNQFLLVAVRIESASPSSGRCVLHPRANQTKSEFIQLFQQSKSFQIFQEIKTPVVALFGKNKRPIHRFFLFRELR
jgi:hypothetical protein